jgi:hypothetical protein
VAVRITSNLPAAVGVPEIRPVAALRVTPGGRLPVTLKLVGALFATI